MLRIGLRVRIVGILTLGFAAFIAGCAKGPDRPAFNAKACAAAALTEYDSDGDGVLSKSEYAKSPGLMAALVRIDADQDGAITADEIAKRIDYYRNANSAVISGAVRIQQKGRPIEDATVTFVPEEFLGDEFQPCSGTTDNRGEAYITRESAEYPGIYLGMYRVQVTKETNGKESLPAKFNTETEIGFEAANDLPGVSDILHFDL